MSHSDAHTLASEIRRRNVFARHSWENNFYIQRARQLGGRTVIEFEIAGTPSQNMERAQELADKIEMFCLLGFTFSMNGRKFLRHIGPAHRRVIEHDLLIEAKYRFVRSKSSRQDEFRPLIVDSALRKAFGRSGLGKATESLLEDKSELLEKANRASAWLLQSRFETDLESAAVKTAIALESLLIVSTSEPLAQVLSERVAFLLGSTPEERAKLSRIAKNFYGLRSAIVHGGKRRNRPSIQAVDAMNRLVLLSIISVATNSKKLKTADDLRAWVDETRWGARPSKLEQPFSGAFVRRAIALYPQTRTS